MAFAPSISIYRIIYIGFAFLPVIWVVGLDQFYWYAALVPGLYLFFAKSERGKDHVVVGATLLFFVCIVLSSVSLLEAEGKRIVTFSRDALTMTLFFCVLSWASRASFSRFSYSLLVLLILSVGAASVLTILLIGANIRFQFMSPMGLIAPDFITQSDFGRGVFNKSLIRMEDAWFFQSFVPRARSLFLYPNVLALVLEVCIPLAMFLTFYSPPRRRILYAVLCLAMAGSFILTLSRAGAVCFSLAMIIGVALIIMRKVGFALKVYWFLFIFLVVGSGVMLVALNEVSDAADAMLSARGTGSTESRMSVYRESFSMTLKNPLGYGTYRDFSDADVPLGSHSQFISMLFKYGFLGFFIWVLFLGYLIASALTRLEKNKHYRAGYYFHLAIFVGVISTVLHQMFVEITLDLTAATVLGLSYGVAITKDKNVVGVSG